MNPLAWFTPLAARIKRAEAELAELQAQRAGMLSSTGDLDIASFAAAQIDAELKYRQAHLEKLRARQKQPSGDGAMLAGILLLTTVAAWIPITGLAIMLLPVPWPLALIAGAAGFGVQLYFAGQLIESSDGVATANQSTEGTK